MYLNTAQLYPVIIAGFFILQTYSLFPREVLRFKYIN